VWDCEFGKSKLAHLQTFMKILLFFPFFAAALQAQTLTLDIGSASESACSGSKWGAAQQASMGAQTPPFNTLRYAANFSCTIPAPIGTCQITLQFLENRPAVATATVPAAGPGLRVFTAAVNGVSTPPMDLFLLAGAQAPYSAPTLAVTVLDGLLRVNLSASKGNASLSGVQATCTPTPPPSTALPKFVTETFPINSGTPVGDLGFIALTLLKTPVPDSGMFINFQSDNWWESVLQFIKPDTSKTVNVIPPNFSGKLQIAYWSLDQ